MFSIYCFLNEVHNLFILGPPQGTSNKNCVICHNRYALTIEKLSKKKAEQNFGISELILNKKMNLLLKNVVKQ